MRIPQSLRFYLIFLPNGSVSRRQVPFPADWPNALVYARHGHGSMEWKSAVGGPALVSRRPLPFICVNLLAAVFDHLAHRLRLLMRYPACEMEQPLAGTPRGVKNAMAA